jgi:hypothetical protein
MGYDLIFFLVYLACGTRRPCYPDVTISFCEQLGDVGNIRIHFLCGMFEIHQTDRAHSDDIPSGSGELFCPLCRNRLRLAREE